MNASPPEYAAAFPLPLYEAFLDALRQRDVQVVTYDDLFDRCDDRDHLACYEREFKRWHRKVRDPRRIYLLIQHDIDFVPDFTRRMVAVEAEHGVRSNVFMFREFIRDVPPDSPYDDTPYEVDHAFFQDAQRRGWVIGYHQNALSRARTIAGATDLFRDDVSALDELYDLRYFCPHGGRAVEIDGRKLHNHDVSVPASLAGRLRWVYNRYAVRFSGRWSDGGIRRVTDPARLDALDLLGFVERMEPGKRYFALVHPQLWGSNVDRGYNPALAERPWFKRMLDRYGSRTGAGR